MQKDVNKLIVKRLTWKKVFCVSCFTQNQSCSITDNFPSPNNQTRWEFSHFSQHFALVSSQKFPRWKSIESLFRFRNVCQPLTRGESWLNDVSRCSPHFFPPVTHSFVHAHAWISILLVNTFDLPELVSKSWVNSKLSKWRYTPLKTFNDVSESLESDSTSYFDFFWGYLHNQIIYKI